MSTKRKQLIKQLKKLNITKQGIAYILRTYDAFAPSRKGNGLFGHVHDTYASFKNGFTTNSESRHCEAPFLLWCELNDTVIMYLDQPEPIKFKYLKNGRVVSHLSTQDFLVVTKSEVYLVECKTERELFKLTEKSPEKFVKTKNGFISPPAIDACQELGFGHKIVTDREFPVCFTRNCYFLLQFSPKAEPCSEDSIEEIQQYINLWDNRSRLSELTKQFGQMTIMSAILSRQLFFDVDRELLIYPERVWVYADDTYLSAVKKLHQEKELVPVQNLSHLEKEPLVWWGNEEWQVVSVNESFDCALKIHQPDKTVSLNHAEVAKLIQESELHVSSLNITDKSVDAVSLLCGSSTRQLDEAMQRLKELKGDVSTDLSTRSLYRLKYNYENAREKYGDGLLGLIDQSPNRGNRNTRLLPRVIKLMETYFKQGLEPSAGPLKYFFDRYVEESERQQLPACSMKTFYKRFNLYAPEPRKTLLQKGARAAYQLGPQPLEITLDYTLTYQGDHAFQIAHIDHTPIEMTFVSKLNGEPIKGTMNLSFMYDAYSRNLLAIHATFEKPSYRATMMLLRECYKRHGTLPLMIVFDRGSDFESVYLDRTLAALGIHKRRRPVGYSRHGSGIERTFGISETELIHHLEGNKQLQKLGRSLSTSHKPQAEWTPDDFFIALKDYTYLYYPQTHRAGIADTPQHRFDQSLADFDELPGVRPSSELQFYLATLPLGRNNGYYTLNKNQIKINHILYRLTKRVDGYNGRKLKVLLKYDPYDIRFVWARIKDRWVQLNTIDPLVRECYDQGIQHAHLEVYGRSKTQVRAYQTGHARPLPSYTSPHEQEKALFSVAQATENNASPRPDVPDAIDINLAEIQPCIAIHEEV